MGSIAELRSVCQPVYKDSTDGWYIRFLRKLSIYLTYVFTHTPISANQVSVVRLLLGLLAGIFVGTGRIYLALLGIFVLQLYYVLGCTSDEMAKYRGRGRMNVVFLNYVGTHIGEGAKWFGLGFYCYFNSGNIIYVLLASIILTLEAVVPLVESDVITTLARKNELQDMDYIRSKEIFTKAGPAQRKKGKLTYFYNFLWMGYQYKQFLLGRPIQTALITASLILDFLLSNNLFTIGVLIAFCALITLRFLLGACHRVRNNLVERNYELFIHRLYSKNDQS